MNPPKHLLVSSFDAVQESLELLGTFHVHGFLSDARVKAPGELVARVHVGDLLDLGRQGICVRSKIHNYSRISLILTPASLIIDVMVRQQ